LRSSGKTALEVSRELGVSTNALREWTKRVDLDTGQRTDGLTIEELGRLRREIRVVTEERDILAKATAFFAGETGKTRS